MDHVIDHLTEPADSFVTAKRHRILLTLNMNRIVRHLWAAIRHENAATLVPIFDSEKPIRSTGDMLPWYTGRPWADTEHSHINRCVFDSAWEASEAFALDRHPDVTAWAKNDHLGFVVCVRRCRPQVSTRFPRAAPDGTHARRRSEGPGLAPERGEAGRA